MPQPAGWLQHAAAASTLGQVKNLPPPGNSTYRAEHYWLGPLYQGRFKAFPVQTDCHFHTVVRYVERNPLRANLVQNAAAWRWSSLGQVLSPMQIPVSNWPNGLSRPIRCSEWIEWVNTPQTIAEVDSVRRCSQRGCPLGDDRWAGDTAVSLGLESTMRQSGRPRKHGAQTA